MTLDKKKAEAIANAMLASARSDSSPSGGGRAARSGGSIGVIVGLGLIGLAAGAGLGARSGNAISHGVIGLLLGLAVGWLIRAVRP